MGREETRKKKKKGKEKATHLLHDTRLPLGEGDVATRLILDELDLDLSALATGLVVIVIIVIGAHAIPFGGAIVRSAIAGGLLQVLLGGRGLLLIKGGSDVGHDGTGAGQGEGEGRGLGDSKEQREKNDKTQVTKHKGSGGETG